MSSDLWHRFYLGHLLVEPAENRISSGLRSIRALTSRPPKVNA
jgi:hypothetical protein